MILTFEPKNFRQNIFLVTLIPHEILYRSYLN